MLGSSRTSFDAAREALGARSDVDASLSDELLAAATALAGSSALRNALSDSGTETAARVSLARSVFEGRLGANAVDVVADVASRRWNANADLVDAVESLGFEAALMAAEQDGRIDDVEDELFRVNRLVAADESFRQVLSDAVVESQAKVRLVESLLSGRVDATTAALVRHLVENPRGRRLTEALDGLVEQSARRRERLLAKVKVALPMSGEQQDRLQTVLGRIYRREVELQVEVEPEVLGGVQVQVGDEVIDGTIAHRLEQVRRRLGAAR